MKKMKKILIIEDEPGVQMTLEDRLHAEGFEVIIKGDGVKGETEALRGGHDLILLDLMLPGKDGYTICRNIRRAGIETPVIMLTARSTNVDTIIGLRQGADDYIAKPFDMEVLIARIEARLRSPQKREVSNGNIDAPVQFGNFLINPEKGELYKGKTPIPLNTQEYRLLLYLVSNSDKILSRNKLLDEVWGYDTETTTRTVDVHIGKIRNKIGESEFPQHILTIRGRGYKFKF